MAYTKPDVVNPPTFTPLIALPSFYNTPRPATQGNLTDEFEAGSPMQSRALLAIMTQKNGAAFNETFFQLTNATALSVASVPNLSYDISFRSFSQAITAHGTANDGNALGLDALDGDLANIDITIYWSDAESHDAIYAATEKLLEKGERKAKEAGVRNEYPYLNYATKWQKPIQGYGQPNVDMLRKVSRKYDPSQLFQIGVPGGSSFPSKGRMKSDVWMWRNGRHVNVSQAQILPVADEFRREKCSDANPLS